MKKHFSLLLLLMLGSCLVAQTPVQPSGSGTEGSPYEIATLNNLYWLQQAGFPGYSIQTADIDASETATWNPDGSGGYYGWPVGDCLGNYDGQIYKISNLTINREGTNYVGLFGQVNGSTITNVKLENVSIVGGYRTGAISGNTASATISKCSVTGTINADTDNEVGGIVGYSGTGTAISECYNSASVSGSAYVGGIVGRSRGTITNSYNDGSVTAAVYPGGLVGQNDNLITNSYNRGFVSGLISGGLVAYAPSGDSDVSGSAMMSFFDNQTSGTTTTAENNGMGLITVQMQDQSFLSSVGWDFSSTWSIDESINDGYPYLQSNLPEDALPITLTEFSAVINNGSVVLSWNTASETDNACFLIYRDGDVIASLEGAGTSSEPHDYSYTDDQVVPGHTYTYMLADLSYANDEIIHENYAVNVTLDELISPQEFVLEANYPNPFNPSTAIPFKTMMDGMVSMNIYNMKGELVRTLVNENMRAGDHEAFWDGRNNAGLEVNSGMYISKLISGEKSDSRKMLLIK